MCHHSLLSLVQLYGLSFSQSKTTPLPGVSGATARPVVGSITSGRVVYLSIGKECTSIQPAFGIADISETCSSCIPWLQTGRFSAWASVATLTHPVTPPMLEASGCGKSVTGRSSHSTPFALILAALSITSGQKTISFARVTPALLIWTATRRTKFRLETWMPWKFRCEPMVRTTQAASRSG